MTVLQLRDPAQHHPTTTVDVFEIGYDNLEDVRIAGWYCAPKPAHLPPPYPGLLIVPGYIACTAAARVGH